MCSPGHTYVWPHTYVRVASHIRTSGGGQPAGLVTFTTFFPTLVLVITLVLAVVGQDAAEPASGVETVIEAFCLRDIQVRAAALGASGDEVLSRALAVGKV